MKNLLEDQYLLSRKCNMSPSESNMLPDFEREIFVNLVIREMAEEQKAIQGTK